MSKPTFVYVTYIAASPQKVWQALTKPISPNNTGSAIASRPPANPETA